MRAGEGAKYGADQYSANEGLLCTPQCAERSLQDGSTYCDFLEFTSRELLTSSHSQALLRRQTAPAAQPWGSLG